MGDGTSTPRPTVRSVITDHERQDDGLAKTGGWRRADGVEDIHLGESDRPRDLVFPDGGFSRRGFLKLAGFGIAGSFFACTRAPVQKAIPLLYPIEEVVPGDTVAYASTCRGCSAGCGILVRCREGRPIKIEGYRSFEGTPDHPISGGGTCAIGQASLLGLYDSKRIAGPLRMGESTTWKQLDEAMASALESTVEAGKSVRLLSRTMNGPTTLARIERFFAKFPNGGHVQYDVPSATAILVAHETTHGVKALPRYLIENAEVLVSFDADFLGAWITPVEHAKGWVAGRDLLAGEKTPKRTFHLQVESRLSLTGSRADRRWLVKPSEQGAVLEALVARLARLAGRSLPFEVAEKDLPVADVDGVAEQLWAARGSALILDGSNDLRRQLLVNLANDMLGAYGKTLDLVRASRQRRGDDREWLRLVEDMESGQVGVLIVHDANPIHESDLGARFAKALENVDLVCATSSHLDETSARAHWVAPDHHFLESFDDAEPVDGVITTSQPVVRPIFDTRAVRESLATWMGETNYDDEAARKSHFVSAIHSRRDESSDAEGAWSMLLQKGYCVVPPRRKMNPSFRMPKSWPAFAAPTGEEGLELVVHPSLTMLEGRSAHNAWLHELPDPVTKGTWGNWVSLAPETAARLELEEGDEVEVRRKGDSSSLKMKLPVQIQPGQHPDVVVVPLGFGRMGTDRFSKVGPQWLEGNLTVAEGGVIGANAAPFMIRSGGLLSECCGVVRIKPTGEHPGMACTQTHHTLTVPPNLAPKGGEVRHAVREISLTALAAGATVRGEEHHVESELWSEDHPKSPHHWQMVVDLDRCTGCSACVTACQVENNVPVVGRDEVMRRREMHWIRIDRYYSGEGEDVRAAFEPMMCQQCDHAPCETVCPVLATVHSEEGLNAQVYNRCVGTRYCANNCPYKVRRFNWFNYPHRDGLENLVLNPDVTVRSRGVMEKCSFCVQRIQEAKAQAKREGRPLRDGEIDPACAQACPTRAIRFGDGLDPKSEVSRLTGDARGFRVLEEINVRPSVTYLALVVDDETGKGE